MLTKSAVKQIPIRIRGEYLDEIQAGRKKIEYRKNSPYWQKRLLGMTAEEYASVMGFADSTFPFKEKPTQPLVGVFICARRALRKEIVLIERLKTPGWFSDQGKRDVDTETCFGLHLGREIRWCQCIHCDCENEAAPMEDMCDLCDICREGYCCEYTTPDLFEVPETVELVSEALRKLEKEEIKKEECKHESMHVLKKYVVCLDCGETEEIKNEWRHLWEKKDV